MQLIGVVLFESVDRVNDAVPVIRGEWRVGEIRCDCFLVFEFRKGVEMVEGNFAVR